jgi:hypothetical protein
MPIVDGERKFACPLHDKERRKRVQKEGFRKGEFDLNFLWSRWEETSQPSRKDKEEWQISTKGGEANQQLMNKKMKMTCHVDHEKDGK